METFLAILLALVIFVGIPLIIMLMIAIVYAARLQSRARALGEAEGAIKVHTVLANRGVQLTILVLLCVYYPIIYYFSELVDHFGWEALHWQFFYTIHDIHRVVFLLPICFAAYCFRIKGAVITTIFAFAVFLPRGIALSPYPDPMSRMVVFVIFALILGIFIGTLRNQNERLQHQYEQLRQRMDLAGNK